MTCLFLPLSRQNVAAVAFAACAVAASACSNSDTNAMQVFSSNVSKAQSITYTYYTVDDPNGTDNEVTGINDLRIIVGSYSPSTATSGSISSYISAPVNTGTYQNFTDSSYPDAVVTNTYTWAISPTASPSIEAGWALEPGGFANGTTSGIVNNQGLWTVMHPDKNEGSGKYNCQIMELLGVNDEHTAVGYYVLPLTKTSVNCTTRVPSTRAFQIFSGQNMGDIKGLNSYLSSEATGINDSGTVVGWATTTTAVIGWTASTGAKAVPMPSPTGALAVKPSGINNSGVIAGEYTDASNKTHGFVYTSGGGYQNISYHSNTVVYGINDHNDICGYYLDDKGKRHGFIAIAGSTALRRRALQLHSSRFLETPVF